MFLPWTLALGLIVSPAMTGGTASAESSSGDLTSPFDTFAFPESSAAQQTPRSSDPGSSDTVPLPASEETAEIEELEDKKGIPDPFEPLNRLAFHFNDKFYFWVLKPAAQGYSFVVPQEFRVAFRNFFTNLVTPVRLVNCLLQGKFKAAGNEAARFGINTSLGLLGLFDQARDRFDLPLQDEDTGQTLGFWGMEPVFYLEWPILGSSSLRDSIGFVGDLFLDPRTYLSSSPIVYVIRPIELINEVSLRIGDYEDLKAAAIDPYVSKRDLYHQYRRNKIKN